MDTAVALVGAYLHLNGYISIPEQPILVGEGKPWRYHTATDLDVLAVRFPHAAVVVPRDGGGPKRADDDLWLAVDPLLELQENTVDVLVAEVKEGRPRLNDALRDPTILLAALRRLDAGFDEPLERLVHRLIEYGEARSTAGGRKWRFRLVAFGDGEPPSDAKGEFRIFPLRHVALFLIRCIAEHHEVWRDAQFGDPILDLLHLLDKLGLGQRRIAPQEALQAERAIGVAVVEGGAVESPADVPSESPAEPTPAPTPVPPRWTALGPGSGAGDSHRL